ncbi:MAG: rod shape-determining protein MreC [Clostridiaceae bacterium]|nr:rod shape-determining protein MreC [Bacillota bacterium]NLN52426.1 rod shape-determining protein MreC [Clostridiaceae bacterium]
MSKNRRKRILIVLVVTVVVAIMMVYSILPESFVNQSTGPLSAIFEPVQKLVLGVKTSGENYFSTVSLNKELMQEVDHLEQQNVDLRLKNKENEALALEYDKLKQAFNLSTKYDYSVIEAGRIVQKPVNKEAYLFRIDKGKKVGIDLSEQKGFPVVNAEAKVFGRIYSSDEFSAKVLPLTHEGFSVSCFIEDNRGQAFVLRGYSDQKNEGLCVLEEIPVGTVINQGDLIITSGLGGVFPYGLEIGEVTEVMPPDQQGHRKALVEPTIEFSDTDVVFVMAGPVKADDIQIEEEN